MCRESHPLCRLKNPTVIKIWLLVGFRPATRSVQSTSADNARKARVRKFIEKERKKARLLTDLKNACENFETLFYKIHIHKLRMAKPRG